MPELLLRGNRLLTSIKLVTYILVSFLLIAEHGREGIEVLAVLIALLVSNSFFRQEYLYGRYGDSRISYASILFEILLIMGISILPVRVGYFVYLFFVTVSESTIVFPRLYGLVTALTVLVVMPLSAAWRAGSGLFWPVVMDLAPAWIVSIMFVYFMSYIVKTQITEREKLARTNVELEDTYRRLLEHMQRTEILSVEKERVRMSREIHDTLAHTLTALLVQMEAVKKMMVINPEQAAVDIENAQSVTREGLSELKRTIRELRPQILESHSFADAMRHMVQDQKLLHIDLDVSIANERADDPSTEVVLLRLLQETMTNAVRHGKADQLSVTMQEENGLLRVILEDNGKGVGVIRKGFGLTGMQERIEKNGGTIQFHSQPGKGFRITVLIPWRKE
jgi:signal transduction histidine kinase